MTLVSPFIHADVDKAFAAYCAMPHAKRADFKKPTKASFRKLHAKRHPIAVAQSAPVREAKGETQADLTQIIAEAVANAVALATGTKVESTPTPANATRKPMTAPAKDAATNRKLWRLNVEGLLADALAASDKPYITDEAAGATLTAAFGPLA